MHVLIWCDDPSKLPVKTQVAASTQNISEEMKGYVENTQPDPHGESGQAVCEDATHWDEEQNVWRLQHTSEDDHAGLRAYFVEVMDALKCHQDVTMCDSNSALQAYVAKYASKFSDSSSEEWLNDMASAMPVAANVLTKYMPYEPEMVLRILGARFRQWDVSAATRGKRDVSVPRPDLDDGRYEKPDYVQAYEDCTWRREDMSLLEYLRKTNSRGDIAAWLAQKYRAAGEDINMDLAAYANQYVCRGEAIVAADMCYRTQDKL